MARSSTSFRHLPIEERFWARVEKHGDDECWPWRGTLKSTGYGSIGHNGKTRAAPQVAWELANNQAWPKGMDSCHSCDNRICVNPAHIWPGTRRDNVLDMIQKGRRRGATEVNARKTHCIHGHPLVGENVYNYFRNGHPCRNCRTCQLAAKRRANLKRRQRERGQHISATVEAE